MEWYAVDRIEGDFAVIEGERRTVKDIPLSELPEGAREGDVLALKNGKYYIDEEETKRRREIVKNLQKKLFKNGL